MQPIFCDLKAFFAAIRAAKNDVMQGTEGYRVEAVNHLSLLLRDCREQRC